MTLIHDYIIVGSGPTGAMAAQTLLESRAKVTMLDVGKQDTKYKSLIPDKDFVSIRQTEKEQYRYLLGDNFESIPWGKLKAGPQLTPPRRFIIESVDRYLQVESETFKPIESLAYGGLGSAWGVGCFVFSNPELDKIGLDGNKMMAAYTTVSGRIGVSGAKDDASPYTVGDLDNYQPEFEIDSNAKCLYNSYLKRRQSLNEEGFYLGKPALAILTKDMEGRKKMAYLDMDYYSDNDQSAYRPWITIEQLKKQPNFNYIGNRLVIRFVEHQNFIEVECINTQTDEKVSHHCRKLILASGVLGTARIVLRSFENENKKLPLLCNPYCYIPCIQPKMLGKEVERNKMGFAQLSMFHDEEKKNINVAMASIYSYRSLMLFRLIKEVPFNFVDGRIIMKYLLSGIILMGIHHPEEGSDTKYLYLSRDESSITGDQLKIEYTLSDKEKLRVDVREKKYMSAMRRLGCYPLKRINTGQGSSIHYAGTLPFNGNDAPYTLSSNGRLNGARNVFVADGSGFKYLPAKGITFSLMANAHLVAQQALVNK